MSNEVTRDSDERGRRWYKDSNTEVMSVTTVLQHLDEDKTGLRRWQRRNQGHGDDMHHQHIFWASGPRGTLCHWRCLEPLADRQLWGEEERDALQALRDGPDDGTFSDASHGMSDILYSTLKNRDDSLTREAFSDEQDFTSVMFEDIEWVADAFGELQRRLGIYEASVIAVERYLLDDTHGFGGQCDLLYDDPSGNTVLADLKTSSGLREKHVLQASAYAMAVEEDSDLPDTVDRLEVVRMDPDARDYTVHSNERPLHIADTAEWFRTDNWHEDPYGDYEYDNRADMTDTFQACIQQAYDETEH